ncbi:hypothetical protein QLX08_001006 [Tetragonisca angustula]|uniref:Uncharacterized protein n=1 Tax=Tetragonisca angustula TaxID=166442 RepID=A0AAW1AGR6_9HYME
MLDVRASSDTRYHFIDLSCPYVNEIRAVFGVLPRSRCLRGKRFFRSLADANCESTEDCQRKERGARQG